MEVVASPRPEKPGWIRRSIVLSVTISLLLEIPKVLLKFPLRHKVEV